MTSIVFNFLAFLDEIGLILLVSAVIFYIILSLSLYKLYKQNNMKSTSALIPVYNVISLLELVGLPKFLVVLIFVPYVNILGIIFTNMIIGWRLSKAFKCNIILTFCLILLPIIGYPLLAFKKLEYHQLESSSPLFVKKVVEEKKEELVIPKYDIDVSDLENVSALDIKKFLNEEQKTPTLSSKSNTKDLENLTFDYNQIYADDVNNEEEKTKMNYDFQNNQSYEPPVDNNEALIEPVIPEVVPDVAVAPIEPVIPEVVLDIPVAPIEPIMPEIVPDVAVAPIEPVIPEVVLDIPVAPIEPVIPEVVPDVAVAPIEPVIPEIVPDIPVAPIEPIMPEIVPDVAVAPIEPVIPEIVPDVAVAPIEPVIPEVVPDIPVSPVEPVIPEPLSSSTDDNMVIESVIPEAKEELPQLTNNKPKPYSKDGYTFDYNSLYNIAPPTEQGVPVKEEFKEKKKEEDVDPLKSLNMAAPPSFEIPVKVEEKVEEPPAPIVPEINKDELVSINIKEPDILPVGTLGRKKKNNNDDPNHRNGVVFAHPPTNSNVNMGNLLRNDNRSNGFSQANPMMANNNINMNNNSKPMINGGGNPQGNIYRGTNSTNGNPNNNMPGRNIPNNNLQNGGNIPQNNAPFNKPPINTNMNYTVPTNQNSNNFNNSNYRGNEMYNSINPNGNNMNFAPQGSLLRPNEDSRSYMNVNQPRGSAKFIANDDTKYTLPKSEPLPVQMPTDPNLIANPMAIFGSSSASLRPTAGEAMQQNYNNQSMMGVNIPNYNNQPMRGVNMPNYNNNSSGGQRPMNNTCPNCGFVIKPGQPSCVVCGYRLM